MDSFFSADKDLDVINAEVMFSNFLVEHNLPLSVADKMGPLFRTMFPDSAIAKKYGCGRTKTTAIVECLASEDDKKITTALKMGPFSLATDGSTDMDCKQLYPLIVRYFDPDRGQIMCVLLTMAENREASTGRNIFKLLDDELKKRQIPWQNCISFAADNAMVMQGLGIGVAGCIKTVQHNVYMLGCPCHLMHIAAEKGAHELPFSTSVEDILVDIWYYLDKSSKRHQELEKFKSMCGTENRKILKHVSTRWLSLGACLDRLLMQWDALYEYFKAEKIKHAKQQQHARSKKQDKAVEPGKDSQKKKEHAARHEKNKAQDSGKKSDKNLKSGERSKMEKDQRSKDSAGKSSGKQSQMTEKDQKPKKSAKDAEKGDRPPKSRESVGKEVRRDPHSTQNPEKHGKACASVINSLPVSAQTFDLTSYMFKQSQLHEAQQKKKALEKEKKKTEEKKEDSYALKKVERVTTFLDTKDNKLYCKFLQSSIPLFDLANQALQKVEPCIHILHSTLIDQLRKILVRFIKASVIAEFQGPIYELDFCNQDHQKADSELFIGESARQYMAEETGMDAQKFYEKVIAYYTKAASYMVKKFPYGDEVLVHAEVANIAKRSAAKFQSLLYFADRYIDANFMLLQWCEFFMACSCNHAYSCIPNNSACVGIYFCKKCSRIWPYEGLYYYLVHYCTHVHTCRNEKYYSAGLNL
jgi:hypothetical protein